MKVTYTRTYTYDIPEDICKKIKEAERMIEAISILSNYYRKIQLNVGLESKACICKTLRNVEILPFNE